MEVNNLYSIIYFRFGSSGRDNFHLSSKNLHGPGPGDYTPKRKQSGGFKFSTDAKYKNIKKNIPGPGQYRIPTSIVDVPNRYIATGGKFMEEFKFV